MKTTKLIFFALFYIVFISSCGLSENGNSAQASVAIQQYVKKQLKSPGTAKFEYGLGGIQDLGNSKFKAQSYVDSQNSFGGTVRTNFSCTVQFIPEKEAWKIVDFQTY